MPESKRTDHFIYLFICYKQPSLIGFYLAKVTIIEAVLLT